MTVTAFVKILKMTSITVVDVERNVHLVIFAQMLDASQVVPQALPMFVVVAVSISKIISIIAEHVAINVKAEKHVSKENVCKEYSFKKAFLLTYFLIP